jgi:nicotinamide-nucleotide amidase
MKNSLTTRAEIIAVGSELLTPDRLDTNSLYLAGRLNELGYEVRFKTVVGDEVAGLSLRLSQALRQVGLVIVIGGLGPTADDRTREAVARALGRKLVFREDILRGIEERFRRRQIAMTSPNRRQAYLVEGAVVLPNANGTAPGQWIRSGSRTVVLLPGPPHELRAMFDASAAPRLARRRAGFLATRTLMTTGLGESSVEALISGLYPKSDGLDLTVLASPGLVELRISSHSRVSLKQAEKKLDRLRRALRGRLRDHIFSEKGESLEEVVGRLLRKQKKTLAVAESCTGGLLGHRLTNIPGSSDYFLGGFVTYSDAAKSEWLGVPASLIKTHGAVSFPVARAMAKGVLGRGGADCGLAVTGVAGPGGGTPDKPVGLVFTALAWRGGGTEVQRNMFLGKRELVKYQSAQKAMDMLRRHLLQNAQKERRRRP